MKVLTNTPDRIVLGRSNIMGGLACLAITPLLTFLGVMMIRDEPAALGWVMIGLAIVTFGLAIAAFRSKLRITLDRAEDIARVSHFKPWGEKHLEAVLSDYDGVRRTDDPNLQPT